MIAASQTDNQEILQVLTGRKILYTFLSTLFVAPLSVERYEGLKTNLQLDGLAAVSNGVAKLAGFLAAFSGQHVEELLTLEREEFCRLFVGPDALPAPPWESVYRSREQLLFDETTLQFRDNLHRFGLQFTRENQEPEDSVSVELEFMAWLITRTEQAIEAGSQDAVSLFEIQIEFLKEHLLQWIPEFADRVMRHTSSNLYGGAAEMLKDFIQFDRELTEDLKEVITHG